jgi:hypothetical protein
VSISERDGGERRRLLVLQLEPKVLGIERDGAEHIADLIPNAMNALYESLGRLT